MRTVGLGSKRTGESLGAAPKVGRSMISRPRRCASVFVSFASCASAPVEQKIEVRMQLRSSALRGIAALQLPLACADGCARFGLERVKEALGVRRCEASDGRLHLTVDLALPHVGRRTALCGELAHAPVGTESADLLRRRVREAPGVVRRKGQAGVVRRRVLIVSSLRSSIARRGRCILLRSDCTVSWLGSIAALCGAACFAAARCNDEEARGDRKVRTYVHGACTSRLETWFVTKSTGQRRKPWRPLSGARSSWALISRGRQIRLCSAARPVRRTCFILSIVVSALAGSFATAHAGDRARLQVRRDDGAADCPDERTLSDAVGARLGYEPFTNDAPRLVVVTFRREGSSLRGIVQMKDADGSVKGERTLSSSRGDCEELASVTTLTISILLDPRSGMIPSRPPEREQTPDLPLPAATQPPDRDVPPQTVRPEPVHLRATLAAIGSIGTAPAPALGVLAGLGIEQRWWSATAEFRADLPASDAVSVLTARTRLTAGNLVPCAHIWQGYICAVLSLGAIQGEIIGASPSRHSSFHAMLGPRIGLSIPVVRWLSLDGHLDASYGLTSTSLRIGTDDLWTTATISGLAGIGIVGRFP